MLRILDEGRGALTPNPIRVKQGSDGARDYVGPYQDSILRARDGE